MRTTSNNKSTVGHARPQRKLGLRFWKHRPQPSRAAGPAAPDTDRGEDTREPLPAEASPDLYQRLIRRARARALSYARGLHRALPWSK